MKGKKTGGRTAGTPNKVTGDLKAMILGALEGAGGIEYLKARAVDAPNAFLSLVGRVLPLQVTGDPNAPLIPPGTVIQFVVKVDPEAKNRT